MSKVKKPIVPTCSHCGNIALRCSCKDKVLSK